MAILSSQQDSKEKFRQFPAPFFIVGWSAGAGLLLLLVWFWFMPRPLELLSPLGKVQPGLSGIYAEERAANFSYRWTAPRWQIDLPDMHEQAYLVRIEAFIEAEREVQVFHSSTGREVGWFRPVNEWRTYSLQIPAQAVTGGKLSLTFQSSPLQETTSLNPRELGIVIRQVTVETIPPIPVWAAGLLVGFVYLLGLLSWLFRAKRPQFLVGLAALFSLALFSLSLWQTGFYQSKFNLGEPELSPHLTGFYAPEQNAGFAFRWSFPNWRLRLSLPERFGQTKDTPQNIQLRLSGLSHYGSPVEVFDADNKFITSFSPGLHWQEYSLVIPTQYITDNRLNLVFRSAGNNVGDRELGLLLTDLAVRYPLDWKVFVLCSLTLAVLASWFVAGLRRLFRQLQSWSGVFYLPPVILAGSIPFFEPNLIYTFDSVLLYAGIATLLIYSWFPFTVLAGRVKLPAAWLVQPVVVQNKLLSRSQTLILGGVMLLGLLARVWNLQQLSIFVDEAFHAKAALDIVEQPGSKQLFGLAVDGKVLHSWLLAGLFEVVPADSLLLVARLFSVVCGLLTILICYKLGQRLISPEVGLLAAGLWAALPFAIWHERLGLVDPLLTTCGGLVFYFSLQTVETAKFRYSFWTALALAAAILTKTSAVLLLFVPGLTFCLFGLASIRRKISVVGLIYTFSWLLLLPLIWLYNGKWAVGQQQEKLATGLNLAAFLQNLGLVVESFWNYFTPPLLLVGLGASWLAWQKYPRITWLALIGGVLPTLVLCLTIKTSYPRYFLVWLVPLMPMLAAGILELMRRLRNLGTSRRGVAGLLLLIFLLPGCASFQLITAPEKAALPAIDRFQYIEGWPAGGNLEKLATNLEEAARKQPLSVLCIDTGTYSSLSTFFYKRPGLYLELLPFGFAEKVQERTAATLQAGPVYIALVDTADFSLSAKLRTSLPGYELRPVWQFAHPANAWFVVAYEVAKK